jgi:hypothetical protein
MSDLMYSLGEEQWFDTVGEALDDYSQGYPSVVGDVYVLTTGVAKQFSIKDLVNLDLVDSVCEGAYDLCGESSEGWLDNITKREEELLESAVGDVIQEFLLSTGHKPTFYPIETGKMMGVTITEVDEVGNILNWTEETLKLYC